MAQTRRLHFVGTMPQFGTAADVFTWQLTELGALLRRLSGGGRQPPTTDPAFYAPLAQLNDGPALVAGIAHEEQPLADQLVVRDLVEQAVGRPVDIATACGLGRRTPEQAVDAVARMRALLG